jgi:hypothetical protein
VKRLQLLQNTHSYLTLPSAQNCYIAKSLLKRSHDLNSLNISYCQNIIDEGFQSVALNCPLLEQLYIGNSSKNTPISNESIQAICDGCPKLRWFYTSNCINIHNSSVLWLVKSCNYLKYVDLSYCKDFTNETFSISENIVYTWRI